MLLWLPRELALVNEPFLVLLSVAPCPAHGLLMDVVLWIFIDLLEPRCSLFVDLEVVLVEGPLPGCQSCIPLPPPQVWFAAWCIGGQMCDAAEEVLIETLGKVFKSFSFPGVSPSSPD